MNKKSWTQSVLVALGALLLGAGMATTGCDGSPKKSVADQPASQQAENFWQTDFAGAQQESRTTGKPILLSFSGSDWCHWCIKLDEEVFSRPEFQQWAKANVIPVQLDFPRNRTLDAALAQQNEQLSEKYGIDGFPTVLLVNADGKELARTGYREGGAQAYIEHLEKLMGKTR